ncbi:MAG: DUF885 domain-containing protein [Parcubacteria group bacterium]
MLSRRQLLVTAAAAGAVVAAPRIAGAQGSGSAQLNALFDQIMAQQLRRSPRLATDLGVDKGDLAWTKFVLSDSSLAGMADDKAFTADVLNRLHAVDRKALSGMDAVNYDVVDFTYSIQHEGNRKFEYGGEGSGAPYILSQLTGAYQDVPDFLDNQHTIETKSDADAYLSRMEAFARQMDEELEVARHDVGLGVVPPDFIVDKALVQMKTSLGQPVDSAPLVQSILRRTKEKGIAGDWATQAAGLYGERVAPAMARQAAFLESIRPSATHDAGVWRLPKGADYYDVSLRQYTTANVTPEEVHKMGLDVVADLSAQADALMKKIGYSKGTVGERYRAMYDDPKFRYPNTDAGKEQLIADLNKKVAAVSAKLPAWFGALPKAALQIKRVPKAIEAGAPGGSYNAPSLDGSRPGIYWINLRDTAEVPSWTLPTLTYHEGIPGHHLQGALVNETSSLPLIRKTIWNSGYGEGWALYAEQVAVEMGMYENDIPGHIGMLHDALFRGVRLVVDSGMHHLRWSREQALKYYIDHIGDPETAAITEIERYVVWPGQACSYMVGKLEWLRLRDKAKTALGSRFDIRKFHDAGLLSGPVPLTVLESVVDSYIASAKKS